MFLGKDGSRSKIYLVRVDVEDTLVFACFTAALC